MSLDCAFNQVDSRPSRGNRFAENLAGGRALALGLDDRSDIELLRIESTSFDKDSLYLSPLGAARKHTQTAERGPNLASVKYLFSFIEDFVVEVSRSVKTLPGKDLRRVTAAPIR